MKARAQELKAGQAPPGALAERRPTSKVIVPWVERRIVSFESAITYLAADQSPCRNASDREAGPQAARL